MKRTPLQRKTPLQSKTPLRAKTSLVTRCTLRVTGRIAPVSTRRARQNREYKRLRDAYMQGHPVCEFPEGCRAASTDLHHKRGRVGRDLLDVDHFAALCRWHHIFVTEHPARAIALGISEPRIGGRE